MSQGTSLGSVQNVAGRIQLVLAAILLWPIAALAQDGGVPTYHAKPDRSGLFVVPNLTCERARSLHPDEKFQARFPGHVYAQPLYWNAPQASGTLLVVTEANGVHALDAATGRETWARSLGKPVSRASLACGNIDPLGITGTPVIDEARSAIYLDALVDGSLGPRHQVFALSLKDGSTFPGWPVDIADALHAKSIAFNSRFQNERGALTILGDMVYVAFGGHFGDCGDYRGFVIGIALEDAHRIASWATRGRGGGIWAPGGISSDGKALFVATGNTVGVRNWSDGEAVFRLPPGLEHSEDKRNFFAPGNWRGLDENDADLGGTNPLPFDLGNRELILALGKDRKAYVLDRNALGGMDGALTTAVVARRPIRTAPAAYPADDGVLVAFQGAGAHCPSRTGEGLTVLRIQNGARPTVTTAWCGNSGGSGSPIVTTTDGHTNPIVWILGAEGDNRLHAFKGDTGEPLDLPGMGAPLAGLRRFQTLIATADRLYVAADGRVYALAF